MRRFSPLLLLALSLMKPDVHAAELSGIIHSSTGHLPEALIVLADRRDKLPPIAGTVQHGRYRITLPDTGQFRLRLAADGWAAAPKYIAHSITGRAHDFLVYPARIPQPVLAAELLRMGERDQEARTQMPGAADRAFWKRLDAQDRAREARLAAMIDEQGWPLISQVGYKAANAAWLIAQHASPAFLKRCLPLMQAAADKHEIDLASLALSIDRVLTNEGKRQRYGSQFQTGKDGHAFALPIEDIAHVDERRASMGLEPFDAYRKQMEQ